MTLRTAYTKTHIKGTKDSCKSQWGKLKRVGKRTDKWVPEKVLHKILDFFFFYTDRKESLPAHSLMPFARVLNL